MNAPWAFRLTLWSAACFDPITALTAVAAVGTAASVAGSISSGIAQSQAANYNAEVDRNNAIQAQQAADQQAVVTQQQTQSKIGQQKVDYAASGVDVGTGTPLDVMNDTATKGKLDALTLRYGGQVQGLRDTSAATLAQYQGYSALTAGALNAGSTLLTGAGRTLNAAGYGSTTASW
jgi:hypothetical protein